MVVPLFITLGILLIITAGVVLWVWDVAGAAVTLTVAGLLFLVGGVVITSQHETDSCHRKGGVIRGTGHYYPVTTVIMSGEVAIPITTMHEETECYVPSEHVCYTTPDGIDRCYTP